MLFIIFIYQCYLVAGLDSEHLYTTISKIIGIINMICIKNTQKRINLN